MTRDSHLVNCRAVDGPNSGRKAGWGATLREILRWLVTEEAVEIFVRVFESVLVDAVVRNVQSDRRMRRGRGEGGGGVLDHSLAC